jgi:hypothetical protein
MNSFTLFTTARQMAERLHLPIDDLTIASKMDQPRDEADEVDVLLYCAITALPRRRADESLPTCSVAGRAWPFARWRLRRLQGRGACACRPDRRMIVAATRASRPARRQR